MPTGEPRYEIGNVGSGAIVLQGENLSLGLTPEPNLYIPVPAERAPERFVERSEVAIPVLNHLLSDRPIGLGRAGVSVLFGLGGIGKSTIARWLIWNPEVQAKFRHGRVWLTLGYQPQNALTILNEWLQLLGSSPNLGSVEGARARLASVLADRAVFFVIDDVWPGSSESTATALVVPSFASRFLLTTRFERVARDKDFHGRHFLVPEMSIDQGVALASDIAGRDFGFIEHLTAREFCRVVGGHPLAIELGASRVRQGKSWEQLMRDLTSEIARLETLEEPIDELVAEPFASDIRSQTKSVRASLLLSIRYLSPEGQRLFAWLGSIIQNGILTVRTASTIWETTEQVAAQVLGTLRGAGIINGTKDGYYRLHDLMYALAREILTAPQKPAREGDIPGLAIDIGQAAALLLARYKATTREGRWHTMQEDDYIFRNLLRHFILVGQEDEIERLLWEESDEGSCGWYSAKQRVGQSAEFIADLVEVWRLASLKLRTSTDANGRSWATRTQLHLGMILSSITSLSASIPSQVLEEACSEGLLAPSAALTLAIHNPNMHVGGNTWLHMVRELPIDDALDAARSAYNPQLKSWALEWIAQQQPPEEGLGTATSIEQPWHRAHSQTEVLRRIPLEQARVFSGELRDPFARALALTELVKRLPQEEQSEVLADAAIAAEKVENADWRGEALAKLCGQMPVPEALARARSIEDPGWRDIAFANIARRLPPEEAIALTDSIEEEGHRLRTRIAIAESVPPMRSLEIVRKMQPHWMVVHAIVDVATRMPSELRQTVLNEAMIAARGINNGMWRNSAIAAVAKELPPAEALLILQDIETQSDRDSVLDATQQRVSAEDALPIARRIQNSEWRGVALAKLASRLPPHQLEGVLHEAVLAARECGPRNRVEVAKALPLKYAVEVVHSIDDPRAQAEGFAEVARGLPKGERKALIEEALKLSGAISDGSSLGEALVKIVAFLPPEEALQTATAIHDGLSRAQALIQVATKLKVGEEPRLIEEILRLANETEDPRKRANLLVEASNVMPSAQALSLAREIEDRELKAAMQAGVTRRLPIENALAIARGIQDARWKTQCIVEITERMSDNEALAIVRTIADDIWPAPALARIAERIPPELALSVARNIQDEGWRGRALAEAASRLPIGDALASAQAIDVPSWRAEALANIAERMPVAKKPQIYDQVIQAIREVDDKKWRARAFGLTSMEVPRRQVSAVLNEMVTTARSIDDPNDRAEVLTDIVEYAPVELRPMLLEEAVASAQKINPEVPRWYRVERAVAKMSMEQALHVAHRIRDDDRREEILSNVVVQRMPAETALTLIRQFSDAWRRDHAIPKIVKNMSSEQTLELARSTDDDLLRDQILAETAPRLPAEAGLAVARSIGHPEFRSNALVKIAEHLPEEQQRSCLWEAVTAAAAIEHAGSRADALRALVQHPSLRGVPSLMVRHLTEIIGKWVVHKRSEFASDLATILPMIAALGGDAAVSSLARSISVVARWWP